MTRGEIRAALVSVIASKSHDPARPFDAFVSVDAALVDEMADAVVRMNPATTKRKPAR